MSFRSIIVAIMATLLVTKSAVVTWVIFNATNSAVQELALGQINASLDSVAEQIESLFEPCERILLSLTKNFRSGNIPLNDPKEMATQFGTLLAFEKGITWINFGFADGSFAGAQSKNGKISISVSNTKDGKAESWDINPTGSVENGRLEKTFEGFDARTRPWFQAAQAKSGLAWTKPYDFVGGGRGISCSLTYRDQEQRLIGVLVIDFSLEEITNYLMELQQKSTCEAIVFLENGQLLAPQKTKHAQSLVSEVLSLLADEQKKDDLFNGSGRIVEEFSSDGQSLIIGLRLTQVAGGVKCLSTVVFNRHKTFGSVEKSLRSSAILSVVALVITLIVATMVAKRVSSPLQSLTSEVARIGRFEIDSIQLPQSFIREIQVLSESIGRMRDSLKSFSKYVPIHIVRDLVKTGGVASLGGEKRLITVLFCDIEGFTGYAEKVTPEKAVDTLTGYFEVFGEAIQNEDGVIDKFLGDGLMALFNAPAPLALHARAACRTAIAAQRQLLQHANQGWSLKVRIGLHTSEALVGNVGTAQRFSYTAIGDGVNLCSRLEGLNKIYGTRIIASSDTMDASGCTDFAWRKLDRVAVVGRTEPLEIYELLGMKEEIPKELIQIAETYTQALEHYFRRDFQQALELLKGISEFDSPSRFLFKRIAELEMKDLDSSWDGVFKATSK
jgi:adenylate cyclase